MKGSLHLNVRIRLCTTVIIIHYFRAADWNLDKPDWVGRMKVISKGKNLFIRLEDKNTGKLMLMTIMIYKINISFIDLDQIKSFLCAVTI